MFHSTYQVDHLYREFVCANKREDVEDVVDTDSSGNITDPNDAVSEESYRDIDSLYDY